MDGPEKCNFYKLFGNSQSPCVMKISIMAKVFQRLKSITFAEAKITMGIGYLPISCRFHVAVFAK